VRVLSLAGKLTAYSRQLTVKDDSQLALIVTLTMQNFRYLKVWEKAHQFTLNIYNITKDFPKHEQFGLISQMRRSSSSIPTNIAEGCGRGTDPDFKRMLQIANGSASEVDYQLILITDLGYIEKERSELLQAQILEIKRMLGGLINKLK
jgi:four helix bundle protein